jgi:predicted homoserine dehydrogenase-like protein
LSYANCVPDEGLKIVQVRRAQDEMIRAASDEPAVALAS